MSSVKLTINQVYTYVNAATDSLLGDTAVLNQDLSNIVDVGTALANADAYESFISKLFMKVGLEIYVNRPYKSTAPNIYRNQVEYGQLVSKVRGVLDDASENQSWKLQNNTSYDDNVFIESTYEVTLFTEKDAYEIRKSITDEQLKGAFTSAQAMTNFVAMVMTLVYNSMEIKRESLVMATLNNMIAETINSNNTYRVKHLLTDFNAATGSSLATVDAALASTEFLKYAGAQIRLAMKKMKKYSTLFNEKGAQNHTPEEMQHLVLVADFSEACTTYLDSTTFHDEFVKLPYHDEVACWQGLQSPLEINVKTTAGHTVHKTAVLGCLFDHDALGVWEDSPTVNTKRVMSADFTNYWFKQAVRYFNDFNENMVVFLID